MKNLLLVWIILILFFYNYTLILGQNSANDQETIQFKGGIGIGTQLYKAFGIENRSISPMWNIHGNASIIVKGKFSLPFSFTVGRQGANGTYPSFRQIGVSPTYEWAKVHIGWRNMRMSDYTLAGRTFYGLGIELNPGILRFSAMKGRLNKGLEFSNNVNPTVSSHIFKRSIYAIKLGLGTAKNHIDLIYMKAKDDPASISSFRSDSLPEPAENAVLGLNGNMFIASNIKLYAELATSIFTRDLDANPSESDFIALTENTITPRMSSRGSYALKSGIEIIGKGWRSIFQYERVMPEYSSMGAYYFREDSEIISFGPSFTVLKNKLRFSGSIGLQRNNLLNTKAFTTKNIIARGNATFRANEVFGINLNFNSFNIKQENGNFELNDTTRIAQINSSYSLAPYWVWVDDDGSMVRTLTASANYQNLNDRNRFTRAFVDMSTWFFNSFYNQTYTSTNFSWNIGSNYNIVQLSELSTHRYGLTIGAIKSDQENKWNLSFSLSYNLSRINGMSDGSFISNNIGIRYTPHNQHTFSLNSNIIRNNSTQFDDYTEVIMNTSYQYSFN
ncbi:MAG: hypothetical protein P1U56_01340 [Saprospiraceae bacterium]|nr:hypothetical protein [Saprospiraceae bacterium]